MKIDFQHRTVLPHLNSVNSRELNRLVDRVNLVISGILTTNLEDTNKLVYAAARFVCDSVGPRERSSAAQGTPPWKVRLSNQLSVFRRELSQLVALREGRLLNERIVAFLIGNLTLLKLM